MKNVKKEIRGVDINKIDIDRIITLTKEIISLLDQENVLLDKMEIKEFEKIYKNKLALLHELEVHQMLVKQKPELIINFTEEQKKNILSLHNRFEESKNQNIHKLNIAISVNRKIVDIIKNRIIAHIESVYGYSKDGLYNAQKVIEQLMPSLSYNNQI